MPVLALDTSAAVAVALVDDAGAVLAARAVDEDRHHAELLAPMVEGVLADADVDRRALTAVVAGTGPAPFTGLRVGLVTARTLALALGIPALGVPSLDALAAAASRTLPAGTRVLVATDARRREVYSALYRVDGPGAVTVLDAPRVGPAADAVAALDGPGRTVVVGRGAALYPDAFAGLEADGSVIVPDPAELARLAVARRSAGEELDTAPLYLRRPDAVPSAGSKRVLG
ncbi:tRNA (adenosine(37)-N6)-threonylcarbamoyltransferase complex dimerization subunit type 1 TsaB [Cellulomonas alba]|uniref:tRNA (Adenosine(37)-N6)-threonylcarbamoyltransferase complex dimerization subunit type 1 TsaB n=1 Tax=Cellulomonas alba TaxID=3053467 RepID=A0ABT7SDM6_9CELL|nr:tRNA (adenosine(37)-N6)-threonylcarbamoyltransferase complex dimerization subunit type 1 TsaB [Cellulomonas alba]MDM7854283.1 tRNA (adenosine(37)-N6)-threonylcarbamoyltransferase complex dimerization subunit type 1 TsaB [Cellulomonas alba]